MTSDKSECLRSGKLLSPHLARRAVTIGCIVGCLSQAAHAENWPQFRGPQAQGRSESSRFPSEWSATKNVAWKRDLPGAGSSSPIIFDGRIYITCYTAGSGNKPGDVAERHLLCIDAKDGDVLWKKSIAAEKPEDPYQGYLREHGFASNTPVTDGQRVYAYFGNLGVYCYDLDGKALWKKEL